MRKLKTGKKFSRPSSQRKALLRNLSAELFLREKIKTTEVKAKELKRFSEKLLTKAKKGDLGARRHLLKFFSNQVVKKLVDEIAPKHKERKGGYTRIIRLGPRKSDGAKMAIIELVK